MLIFRCPKGSVFTVGSASPPVPMPVKLPVPKLPGIWDGRVPIPLKGVVWFGVESGGKAFAGDCGVLNAELRLAVKPCILGVRDAAGPPIVNEAMPDKGSICTGDMVSILLVLGARTLGITPGGGWRALFMTLPQLATIVRIVSDSS